MERIKEEKSILGAIDDLSHRLVMMMLFYAWKYHSAILRMGKITELKEVVSEEIPERAWNIVSGKETFPQSNIYKMIMEVEEIIGEVTQQTSEENRLSLVVAGRTMETLQNYIDQIRDNIADEVPVVDNEAVLAEVRDVAALVDSMLNEYIALEITSTAQMSMRLRLTTFVTAIAEVLIVIFAMVIRARSMKATAALVREPIDKLEEVTAVLADGTLDARITDTEVVELRNLTKQVNTMADRLEAMMKKSEQDAKRLRKAELRTLQAQINPHFLYNTLDAIVWKAEAGQTEEVIGLTSSLSDFFRISLSSGADWIPLSQEKKHIEGYLKIQQTRYRDIMKYEIDIPDEIGNCYILKLLLQPIVENALYHGIKIKRGGGTIYVSAKESDGWLYFCVRDTGCGMNAGQLEELNRRIKEENPMVSESGSGGFGLVNVNMRLRLYYNEPEELKITSSPAGTEVRFRVPCRTKEEIYENESVSG